MKMKYEKDYNGNPVLKPTSFCKDFCKELNNLSPEFLYENQGIVSFLIVIWSFIVGYSIARLIFSFCIYY